MPGETTKAQAPSLTNNVETLEIKYTFTLFFWPDNYQPAANLSHLTFILK